MTQERLESIDQRLATLVSVAEAQKGRLDGIDQRLAALLLVSESQYEVARLLVDGMGILLEGLNELKATTRMQAENIDRLTKIVEALIQQRD